MTEENKTMADIEAEARAELAAEKGFDAPPPVPVKEAAPETEEEADESDDLDDNTEEDGEGEGDAEVETEDKPKKKKSWGEREREKRLAMEDEFRGQIDALKKQNDELVALLKKGLEQPKKEEEEEFEPLDAEADKKYRKEIDALKEQMRADKAEAQSREFSAKAKTVMAGIPQENCEALIATHAATFLQRDGVTREQAIVLGAKQIVEDMYMVHERGGDIADYINQRMKLFGIGGKKEQTKKASINMKEVGALRERAGAPTNKSVSGNVAATTMATIEAQARRELAQERVAF